MNQKTNSGRMILEAELIDTGMHRTCSSPASSHRSITNVVKSKASWFVRKLISKNKNSDRAKYIYIALIDISAD